MSNSTNNNPNGSEQDSLKLLGQFIYSILNSPKILNIISTWPVIGNLIFLTLAVGTGFPFVQDRFFAEETVKASEICEDVRETHVLKQLENEAEYEDDKLLAEGKTINRSDIKLQSSSAPPEHIEGQIDNPLFHCSYTLEVRDQPPQEYNFNIAFQLTRDRISKKVEEEAITQNDMQNECESSDIQLYWF